MNKKHSETQKLLSEISLQLQLLLQYAPGKGGLAMDDEGWVSVEELIFECRDYELNRTLLVEIVAESDKNLFKFSKDGRFIRACQINS